MSTWNHARWRTSSYSSGNTDCVEVATADARIGVRDSKDRSSGQLTVSAPAWSALVTRLR